MRIANICASSLYFWENIRKALHEYCGLVDNNFCLNRASCCTQNRIGSCLSIVHRNRNVSSFSDRMNTFIDSWNDK